ncbi:MAG: DUF6786 family protein [Chloroflexota bacterium]|nr:DUF6786 family protein [Chloroflexota bacterium]
MIANITQSQVLQRLQEHGLQHTVVELDGGARIVVMQRGGRILGPFLPGDGGSILWLNDVWADSDAFSAYLAGNEWNLGGERVWIAPEIQFSVRDRYDFWNTVQCPPAVDPGNYSLDQASAGEVTLCQRMVLEAYNIASGSKELYLKRHIRPAANPLRALSQFKELMDGVGYAGYEHAVELSETTSDDIVSEGWSLLQLHAGGILIIPASPKVEYSDYFDPIDSDHQTIHQDAGYVAVRISGRRQFKVGYKSAHVQGRLAYLSRLNDSHFYLLIRNFFNNPSSLYAEEPPHLPGCRGHSIHVYNDDGDFGGFGELEVMAQTIGGETGRRSSSEQFLFWLFVGPGDRLELLAEHLLGVRLIVDLP